MMCVCVCVCVSLCFYVQSGISEESQENKYKERPQRSLKSQFMTQEEQKKKPSAEASLLDDLKPEEVTWLFDTNTNTKCRALNVKMKITEPEQLKSFFFKWSLICCLIGVRVKLKPQFSFSD